MQELTAAGPSGSQTAYCYDPVGNRVSTTAGCPNTITYDKTDRIQQSGATAYTVDANGNETARGSDTFSYDQANRLISATVSGATTTYTYNGDGLRLSQSSGSLTIPAVWDVAGGLPQLLYDGTRYYIYGLDLLYSINPSGLNSPSSPASLTTHLRIDHQDGLGSVRALTDENGTLVGTLTSDAFGANASQSGVNPQPFGYAGQQVDNTGLVYLRARYYDPSVGRFMSQDTYPGSAGSPLSLNRYTYVLNSPTLTADPSGLSSSKVLAAEIAAVRALGPDGAALEGVPLFDVAACFTDPLCATLVVGGAIALGIDYVAQHPSQFGGFLQAASVTTTSQVNQKIKRKQAPPEFVRAEKDRSGKFGQDHIHILDKNGHEHALNRDGTWRHGGMTLTGDEKDFLRENGWTLPAGQ